MRKLNPGGVLTLTRWFYPNVADGELQPRTSLRLLALARASLERRGLAAKDRVFFLNSANFTVILVKPDGFTAEELETLRGHCAQYRYEVLYTPAMRTEELAVAGAMYPNPLQAYMDAPDGPTFLSAQEFDVTPPVDDRPFFFEVSRFKHAFDPEHLVNPLGGLTAHGILMLLLAEVLFLGLVFVILPLRKLRERDPTPFAARVRLGKAPVVAVTRDRQDRVGRPLVRDQLTDPESGGWMITVEVDLLLHGRRRHGGEGEQQQCTDHAWLTHGEPPSGFAPELSRSSQRCVCPDRDAAGHLRTSAAHLLALPRDLHAVGPEALEIVVVAERRLEEVGDEIDEVDDDPGHRAVAA